MSLAITTFIEALADREQQLLPETAVDAPIYEFRLKDPQKEKFKYTPRCVYFYYLRLEASGALTIWKHFWPNVDPNNSKKWLPINNNRSNLKKIITERATFARKGQGQGFGFGDTWKHKSYIMIFIDEKAWTLHKEDHDKAPVVFNISQGSKPNHSFFDAEDFVIDMPDPDNIGQTMQCSAVSIVNHMKKEDEEDLASGDSEFFHFDLFFEVAPSNGTASSMTVIIDPTGTNQGPPEDPPGLIDPPAPPPQP